jgi:hypothetical protein
MKKIPMLLLLIAPGATLAICYLADSAFLDNVWNQRFSVVS